MKNNEILSFSFCSIIFQNTNKQKKFPEIKVAPKKEEADITPKDQQQEK